MSPRSEKEPYSARRPLDEALPGELDLEGWDSDDDRDNRGPETCLSPSPVPERKKREGQGMVSIGYAPPSPPATKAGSPSEELPTGLPADGGTRARSGGQVREHQVCESSRPHTSSTTQEKVTAGDTLSRMSSSASSRSDLGPFSALRSFDDADPRELAGEGWDSDADWGYGNPEPAYADVDGRTGTKRNRRADPTSNEALTGSKRARVSSALRHALGPPTHFQALRARVGASGESGLNTASRKAKQRRCKNSTSDAAPLRRSTRRREQRAPGNTLGSPSDPQDLAGKEGAAEDGEQSTVNPIEVRSLLPTPAEEDLIDEGTRTRSSSPPSSRSDFGPFSALRPFDDADPRELAGEGWDSDADSGALEALNPATRGWKEGIRENPDGKRTQPLQPLHYGEANDSETLGHLVAFPDCPRTPTTEV